MKNHRTIKEISVNLQLNSVFESRVSDFLFPPPCMDIQLLETI